MDSIIQSNTSCCWNCGVTRNLEEHHAIKGNPGRKLSEKHGLKVRLCPACHRGTRGVHGMYGHELDMRIKIAAQTHFEFTHSREEFMQIFGRSYL